MQSENIFDALLCILQDLSEAAAQSTEHGLVLYTHTLHAFLSYAYTEHALLPYTCDAQGLSRTVHGLYTCTVHT